MAYIGIDPSMWSLNVNKYSYTATAGQTTFQAIYDSVVDVYLNGAKLQDGVDYTATDGVTVVLTLAASVGDVIDIAGYFNIENFNINNYLSSSLAVTKTSNTGAIIVPKGTTSQQPSGVSGYFRFNTDTASFEGYNGTQWGAIGGKTVLPILNRDGSTVSNLSTALGYISVTNHSGSSVTVPVITY